MPISRRAASSAKDVPKVTGHYLEARHGTWAWALDCRIPSNEVKFIPNFSPSVLIAQTGLEEGTWPGEMEDPTDQRKREGRQ